MLVQYKLFSKIIYIVSPCAEAGWVSCPEI
nr:MAG TPA: hypothetical protein [Caudoviricetes sp.]